MIKRTCSIEECDRPHKGRGWCNTHYLRWKRHGDPTAGKLRERFPTDYERFMSWVDTSGGPNACHPWSGGRRRDGYGGFRADGVQVGAHRWLLGYLRGRPLERGEEACHRCDNPPCCNPAHLYAGDRERNMRDMVERGRGWNSLAQENAGKTHCPQGHPYDEENTYLHRRNRQCRACRREYMREWRRKQRKVLAA